MKQPVYLEISLKLRLSSVRAASMLVTICLCIFAGIANGLFPVPLKAAAVVAIDSHPLAFQTFKSVWVAVSGCVAATISMLVSREPFVFSLWGVASAAAWIPAGLSAIYAVPLTGMSGYIVVSCCTTTLVSFFIGWLLLGESMVRRTVFGHPFYAAPLYIVALLVGLVVLIVAPVARCTLGESPIAITDNEFDLLPKEVEVDGEAPPLPVVTKRSWRSYALGVPFAMLGGICSSAQYLAVSIGKQRSLDACSSVAPAATNSSSSPRVGTPACISRVEEEFNVLGSWSASFGLSAVAITAFCWLVLICWRCACRVLWRVAAQTDLQRLPIVPSLHFRGLWKHATAASFLWIAGFWLTTSAVLVGGNAIAMPAIVSTLVITSGAAGMIIYKEMVQTSVWNGVAWAVAALWTTIFALLLANERV